MSPQDKPDFIALLGATFDVYSRLSPMPETQLLWFRLCQPHPMDAVRSAFGRYIATEPKFPPTPAQILAFMGQGTGDNRPGADEAWATALLSRDESATVVWTQETASAFAICRHVLDTDEVGARVAFRDAYSRLVAESRLMHAPVRWVASLGWDVAERDKVIRRAAVAGLLPAPQVAALLPPPMPTEGPSPAGVRQLAKIHEMLSTIGSPKNRIIDRRMAQNEAERLQLEEHKRQINQVVQSRGEK
jgi:hypothetical protein